MIMEENMIVIRDPEIFYFDFEKNLKHGIEFITKSNESLAESKIKNEIGQLLSKYKHENNIHEQGKRQKK